MTQGLTKGGPVVSYPVFRLTRIADCNSLRACRTHQVGLLSIFNRRRPDRHTHIHKKIKTNSTSMYEKKNAHKVIYFILSFFIGLESNKNILCLTWRRFGHLRLVDPCRRFPQGARGTRSVALWLTGCHRLSLVADVSRQERTRNKSPKGLIDVGHRSPSSIESLTRLASEITN